MSGKWKWWIGWGSGIVLLGIVLAWSGAGEGERSQAGNGEGEREVERRGVPQAAWDALKALAGEAEIRGCSVEVEHGQKFYEGSWKGPGGGNVDALVTPAGDLVEIEQRVSADDVPEAVRTAAQKAAGKGTRVAYEKKTMILYEIKYRKGSRWHEQLLTPYGRRVKEEAESGQREEEK